MSGCRCEGTGLDFGGWMGPTPAAPYPRTCPECSFNASPREIQNRYAAHLHQSPAGATRDRREDALYAASVHRARQRA